MFGIILTMIDSSIIDSSMIDFVGIAKIIFVQMKFIMFLLLNGQN